MLYRGQATRLPLALTLRSPLLSLGGQLNIANPRLALALSRLLPHLFLYRETAGCFFYLLTPISTRLSSIA